MNAQQQTVPEHEHGHKLDAVVARLFAGLSRRLSRQAILKGEVRLNGKVIKIFSRAVRKGDVLTLSITQERPEEPAPKSAGLEILYSDHDLVFINKPAGLLSERVPGEHGHAVLDLLESQGLGRGKLVHRLDAGTSGVMVVARNAASAELLATAFRESHCRKAYLLLCLGNPGQGQFDGPIGRDPEHPRRFAIRREGKSALTGYHTLATTTGERPVSVVAAQPRTGRTHQIRVHFASAKHPLLGDALYLGPTHLLAQDHSRILFARPLLHARALEVPDLAGRRRRILAPLPPDFTNTADRLGLTFDATDPLC